MVKTDAPPSASLPATTPPNSVKVWDAFVRLFHWSLVALLSGLVVSAHLGKQEIHQFLGYSLLALLIGRLIWGITGSPHARFRSFVTSPREALRYLRSIWQGHPARYLGHNPAGGWMVLILLILLMATSVTGLFLQATLEFSGPLVERMSEVSDESVHAFVLWHQMTLNLIYGLVPLHLLGVFLAGRQHRENLVLSMMTGCKPAHTER